MPSSASSFAVQSADQISICISACFRAMDGGREEVALIAYGLDDDGITWIAFDLAAQAADGDVDTATGVAHCAWRREAENLLPRERAQRVLDEHAQEVEFRGRERNARAVKTTELALGFPYFVASEFQASPA